MKTLDVIFLCAMLAAWGLTIVIGGLSYPHTIAGAIARWFWSV